MDEKKTIGERCKEFWVKNQKKIKFALGVGVVVLSGYALVKNWEDLCELLTDDTQILELQQIDAVAVGDSSDVMDMVEELECGEYSATKNFLVHGHPMNLPKGRHPSEEALALAEAAGVALCKNQTYRRDHTRNKAA